MHIKTKVDLNKYFLYTGLTTVLACVATLDWYQSIGVLIVYLATIANHYMLVQGISKMIYSSEKKENKKLVILFLGKFIVLILGLSLGVLFMGNKIIIPVINYVIQIFILVFSMKK